MEILNLFSSFTDLAILSFLNGEFIRLLDENTRISMELKKTQEKQEAFVSFFRDISGSFLIYIYIYPCLPTSLWVEIVEYTKHHREVNPLVKEYIFLHSSF